MSGTFASFVLEKRIAVGGTSEVYLARSSTPNARLPARFVVKRPLPDFQRDPKLAAMFEREARLQSRLDHPCVVKVLDHGRSGGEAYLVTEYVEGEDADRLLRRLRHQKRRLAPELVATIGVQLFEALAAVHEANDEHGRALGIVHRDVSPSNVYFARNGALKLGDFGLAHSLSATEWRSQSGSSLKGKFAYLAPEQVAGDPCDQRSDLFSAATVLAEFLLGQPLFASEGHLALLLAIRDAKIDPLLALDLPIARVLQGALARSPHERVHTAWELAAALRPLQSAAGTAQIAKEILVHGLTPRPPLVDALASSVTPLARTSPPLEARPTARPIPQEEPTTSRYPVLAGRVHYAHGGVGGPFSYSQLVEMVATYALERGDRLELEGRGLIAVEDLPELARFLPPLSERRPAQQVPARGILALLGRLYAGQATGVLIAERDTPDGARQAEPAGKKKEIYLERGVLHHVQSSDKTELFGEYLCRRGLIDRDELEVALSALPVYRGRLGDTLIALGLADPVDIFRAIRAQGRDRVLDLFRWTSGALTFIPADEVPEVEFPLETDLLGLLWSGVEILEQTHGVESVHPALDRSLRLQCLPHGESSLTIPAIAHVLETLRASCTYLELLSTAQGLGVLTSDDIRRAVRVLSACQLIVWE